MHATSERAALYGQVSETVFNGFGIPRYLLIGVPFKEKDLNKLIFLPKEPRYPRRVSKPHGTLSKDEERRRRRQLQRRARRITRLRN